MAFKRGKQARPLILTVAMAGLLVVTGTATTTSVTYADTTGGNNGTTTQAAPTATTEQTNLQTAFEQAAQEFGVPQSVLMSVAYNESLWDQHDGQPSMSGGYGIMHLTQMNQAESQKGDEDAVTEIANAPGQHTLDAAAQLLGVDPDVLKNDPVQNIRGGAALLAQYAKDTVGTLPENPSAWYGAVAKYSGSDVDVVAQGFADDVYATIQQGAARTTDSGQQVQLTANAVTPDKTTTQALHLKQNGNNTGLDCPNGLDCQYVPAAYSQFGATSPGDYGNYDLANRPSDGNDIRYIVIHDTEENYANTIKTFMEQSYTSAHYVVSSATGQITEMVRPENVAWQAGNWYINSHSIGIEHEGYAADGTWYTEQMYRSSAKLVKYLADRYHVTLDREHIIGHDNVPGTSMRTQTTMHWDPATYWNWSHYFDLLGASFEQGNTSGNGNNADHHLITINPNFQTNQPSMTYQSKPLTPAPSNFVYLYTAPSFNAPLVGDPALHPNGGVGTDAANDWGDKAVAGQEFYQADSQGDWTAIYYGGQKVWFYNPGGKNATPGGNALLLTPKTGISSIPVYGTAYPETSAFTGTGVGIRLQHPLQYTIPAGQVYTSTDLVQSDYYNATLYNQPATNRVVKGTDQYYEISFNHRIAFVKASDVDVIGGSVDAK